MIYKRIINGNVEETDAKDISFDKHYDIIVAGVGTAGSYAVLSAAMQGVNVLGIDKYSGIGGMGTFGYVNGYYYGVGGGLHIEIDREAQLMRDEMFVADVEAKKYLLEKKATDNGAVFLFDSTVTGVFLEGKTAKGISVLTNGSLLNISCGILIDATAEAEICVIAGCEVDCGRESDGKNRPYTSVKVWLTEKGDIARTNHDSGYVNQYDPMELSKAIISAHASQLLDEFHNEQGRVIFLAPFIGIREGRRIIAENTITMENILLDKLDKNVLFYAYSDFDKHGKDNALETELLQDWYVASNLSTACLSVPISIKAMVPKNYQSIIVAGRHLGVDHDTASLARMKRDMHKCGESAGLCAALAIKKGVQPIDVPYGELKEVLEKTGCLNAAHHVGIMFDDSFRRMKIQWLMDPMEIKEGLRGDMPGIAIYSCKRLGSQITAELKKWLSDENQMLVCNSAIALGLIGDQDCLPVLRDIVKNRDCFYYKDCRRTNQLRTVIAIYLLGKIGDIVILPVLKEILCDENEYNRGLYHEIRETSYKFSGNKNFNEVYFQIVSYSAIALTKIIGKNPSAKQEILTILEEAFSSNHHIKRSTSLPEGTFEYESMNNIKNYIHDFRMQEGESNAERMV